MDHRAFFKKLGEGDIAAGFLFHGMEEYVKQSALAQLIEKIDPAARDFNVQDMEKPVAQAVQAACETLPFFAERRLVIVKDMQDAEIKQLLPYVATLPKTTTLVLFQRGACNASTLKAIQASSVREVVFDRLDEQDALRYIKQTARKRNITIEGEAAMLLLDMVGTDVFSLHNELTKVLDYVGEGACAAAGAVRACITPNPEYQRYTMLDDLLGGRKSKAMRALVSLLEDGSESPFGLAHFFSGQFKNMLSARLLLDTGVPERDIGKRLGLYARPAHAAIQGAKRLSAQALRDAVTAFCNIDHLQVSGQAPAAETLQMAVMQYLCN